MRNPARMRGPVLVVAGLLAAAVGLVALGLLAAAGLLAVAAVVVTAVAAPAKSASPRAGINWSAASTRARTTSMMAASRNAARPTVPMLAARDRLPGPARPTVPMLAARDRPLGPAPARACAAMACVDLAARVTWLQVGETVTFGPVRMEPGPLGTPPATPRGRFRVTWKAGPDYVSTSNGEPMPWAVFFAPGGIAFHGCSFAAPSHGCVHLAVPDARHYNAHLPIGAEVVVF